MAEPQRDVIEILTADHREVETISTELESLPGATDDTPSTGTPVLAVLTEPENALRRIQAEANAPGPGPMPDGHPDRNSRRTGDTW